MREESGQTAPVVGEHIIKTVTRRVGTKLGHEVYLSFGCRWDEEVEEKESRNELEERKECFIDCNYYHMGIHLSVHNSISSFMVPQV